MHRWRTTAMALIGAVVLQIATVARSADRDGSMTYVGKSVLSTPLHVANHDDFVARMASMGYENSDVYQIPLRETGGMTLIVRFAPKDAEQGAAEAAALLVALVEPIAANRVLRVGFQKQRKWFGQSDGGFDYLFWRNANDDWIAIEGDADRYFEDRLARAEKVPASVTRAERVYNRAMLANIAVTRGRNEQALEQLRAALADVDSASTPDEVPVQIRFLVLAGLLQQAAVLQDDPQFDQWIQRYALLLGDRPWTVDQRPVFQSPPDFVVRSNDRRGGHVELEFDVDDTGRPRNVTVVDSHPDDRYDKAGISAMEKSRFLPRVEGGRVVWARARFRWVLKNPAEG